MNKKETHGLRDFIANLVTQIFRFSKSKDRKIPTT